MRQKMREDVRVIKGKFSGFKGRENEMTGLASGLGGRGRVLKAASAVLLPACATQSGVSSGLPATPQASVADVREALRRRGRGEGGA
ncbi:hypothetical protein O3P69_003773 [Scylla paramamosain]|uniref:Uncharacterized protein n=1 Tax=Scylla paramamosain TaxID=85552 RepID=A0AAW0UD90_SCYPA